MQYQWNSSEEKCAYVLNAAMICLFILIIHLGYRSNHSCLSLWHLMMIGGDKGVCEIYSGNFSDWVACGLRKTARQAAVYFCSKSLKKTLLGVCLEIDWSRRLSLRGREGKVVEEEDEAEYFSLSWPWRERNSRMAVWIQDGVQLSFYPPGEGQHNPPQTLVCFAGHSISKPYRPPCILVWV